MKPVIVFEKVSKWYPYYMDISTGLKYFVLNLKQSLINIKQKKIEALRDVSFTVLKGESWGILGRNGAGKSTLLGLIAGVIKPSKGSVKVVGRVVPLLELGAGFHPELTGRENIVLNGVLLGLTIPEIKKQMKNIIDFSELGDFIDQPIRTYSSGMLARLGFSIAVFSKPDILLIDEILAVGDISFQKKCLNKILALKNKGVTLLVVSHSVDDILKVCDKAIFIEDHKIKFMGDVDIVVNKFLENS